MHYLYVIYPYVIKWCSEVNKSASKCIFKKIVFQEHRNRVFHDFRNGLCRNLVCTGKWKKRVYNCRILPVGVERNWERIFITAIISSSTFWWWNWAVLLCTSLVCFCFCFFVVTDLRKPIFFNVLSCVVWSLLLSPSRPLHKRNRHSSCECCDQFWFS